MSKINLNALKKTFNNEATWSIASTWDFKENITNYDNNLSDVKTDIKVEEPFVLSELNNSTNEFLKEKDTLDNDKNSSFQNLVEKSNEEISIENHKNEISNNNNVWIVWEELQESNKLIEHNEVIDSEVKSELNQENLNSLNSDKDLFSNYTSETKKIEPTILEKIKKLWSTKYIKTDKVFLVFIITITFVWIWILFRLNPKLHSIDNYKASILNSYETLTKSNKNTLPTKWTNTWKILTKTNTWNLLNTNQTWSKINISTWKILTKTNTWSLFNANQTWSNLSINKPNLTYIDVSWYKFSVYRKIEDWKEVFFYKNKTYSTAKDLDQELKKELIIIKTNKLKTYIKQKYLK